VKAEKKERALLVRTINENPGGRHDYFKVRADVVEIENVPFNGEVLRNGLGSGIEDLVITCQNDRDNATSGKRSYGFQARYEGFIVADSERVVGMYQQLRQIDRGLEKLDAKYGPATDFATYLLRVADVLGVTRFVVTRDGQKVDYDDVSFENAAYVSYWVNEREAEYVAACAERSGVTA
jgi:hypothetical protein